MAPRTLTRQEFGRSDWARNGGRYIQYLNYVKKRRSRLAPTVRGQQYDPLRPIQDPQAYAQRSVTASLKPLIDDLTRRSSERSALDARNIQGYTQALAGALGTITPQIEQIYSQMGGTQGRLNEASSAQLSGAGAELKGRLQQALGSINAPDAQVEQVAGGIGREGQGAAGAEGAKGAAVLADIIAQGSAASGYAGKQPGFAGLMGWQALRENTFKSNADLQDQISQLTSQAPGAVQQLLDSILDRNMNLGIYNREFPMKKKAAQQDAIDSQWRRLYQQEQLRLSQERNDISRTKGQGGSGGGGANSKKNDQFQKVRTNAFKTAAGYAKSYKVAGVPQSGYAVSKAEAYKRMYTQYAPQLRSIGVSEATIKQMIQRAIATAYGSGV